MHSTDSRNGRIARLAAPAALGIAFSLFAFTKTFSAADGTLFDALLLRRPAPAPAREILLLEADSAALAEAGRLPWNRDTLAEGLSILTEMEAASVVYDAAVMNETVRSRGSMEELRAAFDREFGTIKGNVRSLFEAIRLGSVRPKDASAFVEEILTFADAGKARLLDAAGNRERDRQLKFEQAVRVFGSVHFAEAPLETDTDLVRRAFARAGLSESQDPLGHALLAAVRERLGNPALARTPRSLILRGASVPGGTRRDMEIPLWEDGDVVIETPRGTSGSDFRRLSYELLLRHARLEAELVAELAAMERSGYLANIGAELSPAAIYAYARETGIESTAEWRALRVRFYRSASNVLAGEAERLILDGYDKLLASPTLSAEGKASLAALKSAAANSFGRARSLLSELARLRIELKRELERSICVVAPALRAPVTRVKAAASLADAILSDRFIRPIPAETAFAACAALAIVLSAVLAFLGPVAALSAGAAGIALSGAAASALLVLSGIWLNPLLAAGAAGTATLASTFLAFNERGERKRALLRSFAPRVSSESLRKLASAHYARLVEGEKREASIVAVRAKGIADHSSAADSKDIVSAFRLYHETIGGVLKKEGALLYAIEGELIFASFGAPVPCADHRAAAVRAAHAVVAAEEVLARAFAEAGAALQPGILRVGIDSGLCDFGEAGLSGFSVFAAFGPVPVRARVLSNLAERYGCRVLATENVKRGLGGGFEALRLDQLVTKSDGSEEYFYELRGGGEEDAAME